MNAQSRNQRSRVVARQQQGIYTQLINNLGEQASGQLVGDLWIDCGAIGSIPYGGFITFRYT
jgi:hypothetical protein